MSRMLWLGVLVLVGLLLSLSVFASEVIEEPEPVDEIPDTDLPVEEQKVPDIHLEFNDRPSDEKFIHIPEHNVPIPKKEEVLVNHGEIELEQLPDLLPDDDMERHEELYRQRQEEAIEHMRQVAEESNTHVQDEPEEIKEPEPVTLKDHEYSEDDVIEGEYIGVFDDDDNPVRKDEVDAERQKEEAINRVEQLRRSDRKAEEDEQNRTKKMVYIKAIPPERKLEILPQHELEEEEDITANQVVFLDSDSHAHVVHKHKTYATRVLKHDEM